MSLAPVRRARALVRQSVSVDVAHIGVVRMEPFMRDEVRGVSSDQAKHSKVYG